MGGMAQKVRQIVLKPVATPIEIDPALQVARASVQEPVFGALAGDRVAAKIDAAISLSAKSVDSSSRPSMTTAVTPSNPISPIPATNPPVSPVAVQDPFN